MCMCVCVCVQASVPRPLADTHRHTHTHTQAYACFRFNTISSQRLLIYRGDVLSRTSYHAFFMSRGFDVCVCVCVCACFCASRVCIKTRLRDEFWIERMYAWTVQYAEHWCYIFIYTYSIYVWRTQNDLSINKCMNKYRNK